MPPRYNQRYFRRRRMGWYAPKPPKAPGVRWWNNLYRDVAWHKDEQRWANTDHWDDLRHATWASGPLGLMPTMGARRGIRSQAAWDRYNVPIHEMMGRVRFPGAAPDLRPWHRMWQS